jgi:hypothetical protein
VAAIRQAITGGRPRPPAACQPQIATDVLGSHLAAIR